MFGWCVFLVFSSVWKGVNQSKQLTSYKDDLDQIKLEVAVKERYIKYQKTDSFIEKQAREHFGYAKPGETIVNLPENSDQSAVVNDEEAAASAKTSESVKPSYVRLWWQYFFGK